MSSSDAKPTAQFTALAGLRGVAALAVVQFHGHRFLGGAPLPGGYMAVDFFFLLSGWVLAHAYDRRLETTLTAREFFRLRLIRLYPVYLLALTLATAAALGDGRFTWPWLLASLFILPNFWADNGYWLIGPAWSLAAELGVNIPFALAHRWLGRRVLHAVVTISLLALVVTALLFGDLNRGHSLGNWWAMLPRVCFSFPLGVLLYRERQRLERWAPKWSTWPAFISLAAILSLPSFGQTAARDLLVIAVAFPLLLLFAANAAPGPRTARLAAALGAMSYPLYLLHKPMIEAANAALSHLSDGKIVEIPPPYGLVFLLLAIGLAIVIDRWFDQPVRRWLTARAGPTPARAPAWPRGVSKSSKQS